MGTRGRPGKKAAWLLAAALVLLDIVLGQVANEVTDVTQGHPDGGIVFTDDRAPIEQITDQLLISYIQQH